ncbi:saccharopine dehydrogenase [Palleronia abyssalis]|mgnify:CR=1 FL=1|uniref:Saccharopine dehydrogenase [NAD(+), L-lysine-forming] n=1 Tax=Palleronia abyssalis TaxID=1501240 RepID=A0A2R8BTA8_9RHOB|nr:saccharopine dehydrogenase [Palleronia abyssalis]SPJ23381.1 hypothetical protein PAA8504_01191 [Palleronia abyssalis]
MPHLWIRAESRPNEDRVGITSDGVAHLIRQGFRVTVEDSPSRTLPLRPYLDAGAERATAGSWPDAPRDAYIFGLKELPDDGTPLPHTHIMFGHAYKGQTDGARLLSRFANGGGRLLDLEYLTDEDGRRVAAFGYWAGFVGAAVSVMAYAAQMQGTPCPPIAPYSSAEALVAELDHLLNRDAIPRPDALIVGAKGRVGTGAADLCDRLGIGTTLWDVEETRHGGPFPEVLDHAIFLNCILAGPGCPVFVPEDTPTRPRTLGVIGDIACDPASDFNPIRVYDRATDWSAPVVRVYETPPLDVMAIDNLPSMLPVESSVDFAGQLLKHLATLGVPEGDVWVRADKTFRDHVGRLAP